MAGGQEVGAMVRLRPASGRILALLLLTVLPPTLAAALSTSYGLRSAVGLAPQASAPPPFAIFHDLRWISVYHDSWPQFAGEFAVVVVVRGLWTAAIVLVAWPSHLRPRPTWGRALLTGVTGSAALAVVMLPWAAISVALSTTSLSWFFIGDVGSIFVLALVMQRAGLVSTWWQGAPPLAGALWIVLAFLILTTASVLVSTTPGPLPIVLAAAAGAVNAWLWRRLLAAALAARVRLARVPVAPLVAVGLVVGIAPAGFLGRAAVQDAGQRQPPAPLPARQNGDPPPAIIYVDGFDSAGDGGSIDGGRQVADSIPIELFSYAGVDEQGRPLPYRPEQTQQSLERSAALLDVQVTKLHGRTGKPVALLGDSEGTLVVRTYLQTHPHPDVVAAVLLNALPNPAVANYPPPGARHGWGLAAGAQLQAIMAAVRWSSGLRIDTDAPFLRSLLDNPQRYRDQMFCPVPGTRLVAFVTLDAALADRPGGPVEVPFVLVDTLHGGAYDSGDVRRQIVAFLDGEEIPAAGTGVYRVLRATAVAWQAPPLRLSLVDSAAADDGLPHCHA
ncbi:hypothetical protein ABZ671_13745 [Micromonospora sp. NPDC006766]|uniref:hypothetical protein n=1 Tax=Micromonospora sp. NPDC006766 TaxID=3154778 RepID=UPI0033E700B3